MSDLVVPLDNDFEFEFDIKRKATTTGVKEAAAGLTSVTAHFALTEGGAAMASSSTALTERSAKAGRYYGILAKATLATAVGAYVGQRLWLVLSHASVEDSKPVVIRATSDFT